MRHLLRASAVLPAIAAAALVAPVSAGGSGPFLEQHTHVVVGPSTVPANGDVNPYGVAVVHRSTGLLHSGDVLVSNFNNSANLQGTGSTIVDVAPNGSVSVFAQLDAAHLPGACPGGVGLTTALVVLRSGWVVVGSLPSSDGTSANMKAGCLIVIDSHGRPVETLSGGAINGPWDMTAVESEDGATLFVTNVLNDTVKNGQNVTNKGTVLRIGLRLDGSRPREAGRTVIASGLGERTDPSALVVGPTGVGMAGDGTLYLADSVNSRIAAIPDALGRHTSAGVGRDVTKGGFVNDPLGLAIAPNGDVLTVNGADGNIVETTPGGAQVAHELIDSSTTPESPPGAGALFGIAIAPRGAGVYFVDDATNNLDLLR